MTFRFSPQALPYTVTPIDNLFLAEYMPRATGLQTQVYLYGLFLCHGAGAQMGAVDIARTFSVSQQAVLDAFTYWQGKGLVRILSDSPLEIEYLSLRIQGYAAPPAQQVPGQYYELVERLQRMLAPRTFGASEMRYVAEWIEVYGFEQDTVAELIGYCLSCTKGRAGIKYMDTVARSWADANVRTPQEALAYITDYEERMGGAAAVLKRWRMGRRPSEDELALYARWTKEWGFDRDAVLEACTGMTSAANPSFDYLNGILKRLYEAGCTDAESISHSFALEREQAELAREVFTRAGILSRVGVARRKELWALLATMPREVLLYAAERAREKREPYSYLKRLAQRWREQGVNTLAKAQAEAQSVAQKQAQRPGAAAFDYEQRTYTDEELSRVIVDLEGGKE